MTFLSSWVITEGTPVSFEISFKAMVAVAAVALVIAALIIWRSTQGRK
jgi:hypothetical protein